MTNLVFPVKVQQSWAWQQLLFLGCLALRERIRKKDGKKEKAYTRIYDKNCLPKLLTNNYRREKAVTIWQYKKIYILLRQRHNRL